MGRPDPNVEPPRRRGTAALGFRYELAWGQDPGSGPGWHSSTEAGEHITLAQWQALTAAAVAGEGALDAALLGSTASRAWRAAQARAGAQAGALLTACRARYAAWDGESVASAWVTA
jgi:hypothetical protein